MRESRQVEIIGGSKKQIRFKKMSLGANYSGEKKYGDEQPFPSHTPDESRKAILHNADAPEKKPVTIKRETSQISAAAIEHHISEVKFDKQSEANGIISTAEKRNPHAKARGKLTPRNIQNVCKSNCNITVVRNLQEYPKESYLRERGERIRHVNKSELQGINR